MHHGRPGPAGTHRPAPAQGVTIPACTEGLATPPGPFPQEPPSRSNEFLPTGARASTILSATWYHLRRDGRPSRHLPRILQKLLNTVRPSHMVKFVMRPMSKSRNRGIHAGARSVSRDRRTLLLSYTKRMETVYDRRSVDHCCPEVHRQSQARQQPLSLSLVAQSTAYCNRHPTCPAEVRGAAQLPERLDHSTRRMAQLDERTVRHAFRPRWDEKLKDMGVDDHLPSWSFHHDNGTESVTWPDGGQTPFRRQSKGTVRKEAFSRAARRGIPPGRQVRRARSRTCIISPRMEDCFFPTFFPPFPFLAAARHNPEQCRRA